MTQARTISNSFEGADNITPLFQLW